MNFKKDFIVSGGVALALAIICLIIGMRSSLDKSLVGLLSMVISIVGFLVTFFASFYDSFMKHIDDKFDRIIEHSALWTENSEFTNRLEFLRNKSFGSVKWLIAKFISYKLDKDFYSHAPEGIDIHGVESDEYSKLLSELIREAKNEILITCPYIPRIWFKNCKASPCINCTDNCLAKNTSDISLQGHINAIANSTVPKKKRIRLVNTKWPEAVKDVDKKCREHFLNIASENKLVVYSLDTDMIDGNCDIKTKEFNIFDGVVVMWDEKEKICKINFGVSTVSKYRKLFDKEIYPHLTLLTEKVTI